MEMKKTTQTTPKTMIINAKISGSMRASFMDENGEMMKPAALVSMNLLPTVCIESETVDYAIAYNLAWSQMGFMNL